MPGKSVRLRWLAAVTTVATASLTAACSSSSPASTAAAGPSGSLTVSAASTTSSSAGLTTINVVNTLGQENLQVAQDEGFFKKYGLKLNISYLDNGTDVLAALEGGSADIGYADLYAGVDAVANGFNVKLVANNNGNPSTVAIAVEPNSDITTAAQLAGKKIGLPPVPQHTVNTRGFLKANGVNPYSVNLVVLASQPALPQALKAGSIDAFFTSSYSVIYQYGLRTVGNGSTASWSNPLATTAAFWSTGGWASAHPQVEDEFDDALHAFDQWWRSLSPSQSAAVELKYYGLNFEKLSGGNSTKLQNLIASTSGDAETGPINISATEEWYQLGLTYAPDKISKGVNLKSIIFPSALQPSPSSS